MDLKWNAYYYSINEGRVKPFNIFDHGGFCKDIRKYLCSCESKDEFVQNVKSSLMYYFWSKCEWEVLVSPWVAGRQNSEIKVDVYDQVMLNWDVFVDYVWGFHTPSQEV